MSRRLVFVIAAGLVLNGGCPEGACYIQPQTSTLASWDGLGPFPKRNNLKPKTIRTPVAVASNDDSPNEEELAALKPYSKEWWSIRDAIDHVADIELSKKLIICLGCMPSEPGDQTGSITTKYLGLLYPRSPFSRLLSIRADTATQQCTYCEN